MFENLNEYSIRIEAARQMAIRLQEVNFFTKMTWCDTVRFDAPKQDETGNWTTFKTRSFRLNGKKDNDKIQRECMAFLLKDTENIERFVNGERIVCALSCDEDAVIKMDGGYTICFENDLCNGRRS